MKITAWFTHAALLLLHFTSIDSNEETKTTTLTPMWSFYGTYGPTHWAENFPQCAGERQSPIAIDTDHFHYDDSVPNYHTINSPSHVEASNFQVYNDGRKIGLLFGHNNILINVKDDPNICLQPHSFHFHWGHDNHIGSEHRLNGFSYPMEGHLVTYDCKRFKDFETAIPYTDGLIVFAFFYKVVNDKMANPIIQSIVNTFSKPNIKQCNACYNDINAFKSEKIPSFDITKLFPSNVDDYWTYYGSLTTPECNEDVRWVVFNSPNFITSKQIAAFRKLKFPIDNGISHPMVDNFRPLMQINNLKNRHLARSFKLSEDTYAVMPSESIKLTHNTITIILVGIFIIANAVI